MISLLFFALASVVDAARDKLDHHYHFSIFNRRKDAKWSQFWNPKLSWRNKYRWYVGNKKKPKFFGSTTFFVWLTDGWHLLQFIEIKLLILAVLFYEPVVSLIVDFAIYWGTYALISEIFYKFVLHDNKKDS